MKRAIGVMFLFWALAKAAGADSLNIVANQWPPYVDQSLSGKGMAMEIVAAALERKGYRPTVRIEDWPRALEGLEIGIFDAAGAIWKTAEREKLLVFSRPYWINRIKFVKARKLKLEYGGLDDLSGYLIGVTKDYAYDEAFLNAGNLIKIPQNHFVQNLLKLSQGEIDLTLDDEWTIRFELNRYMKESRDDFELLEKPLTIRGLHLAVSKQRPDARKIIADFDQAIIEMKADGSFDDIVEKYHF
ncbi:MAG: substrate-binding periplasmic protein [Gammaproteobacteria bacterium]